MAMNRKSKPAVFMMRAISTPRTVRTPIPIASAPCDRRSFATLVTRCRLSSPRRNITAIARAVQARKRGITNDSALLQGPQPGLERRELLQAPAQLPRFPFHLLCRLPQVLHCSLVVPPGEKPGDRRAQ